MKVIILKETLDKIMPAISRVVPARGQLPVLSNVLIRAERSEISFAVTNLELGLVMTAGGKVIEEGSVTIPAKSMAEFVSLTRSKEIILETDGEKLKLIAGKSVGVFAGISATEFPLLPTMSDFKDKKIVIKAEKFDEVASAVGYAASVDEARLVLTGIKFYIVSGKVRSVATDGFRLARLDLIELDKSQRELWPENLIVPARTVAELAKLASDDKKQELVMEIMRENNQIIFMAKEWMLVSRILEGNFPDVEKLIPGEFKTRVGVDRKNLIEAVRTAAIFARENSNIVKFGAQRLAIEEQKGVLRISAVGGATGEEESQIEAEMEGDDVEIAFNYKYVLEVLGSLETERVFLESNGSQMPGVWRGEGRDDLVSLIMPVRI